MARDTREGTKGTSLAKGPVGIMGIVLLAIGILLFIFASQKFKVSHPPSGDIKGTKWLGVESNGWTALLFAASGLVLLFSAPLHWGAKTMSLVVGLVLGAASVIALVDKEDVFGIFAANGPTTLVWGAAAVVLLILALLPRVGGRDYVDDDADDGVRGDRGRRRRGAVAAD